jgi:hypothetical protein
MRRAALVSSLAIGLGFAAIGLGAQTGGPTFKAESMRIDLGEIKSGTVAEATFVFHNEGTEDVRILRAKPS